MFFYFATDTADDPTACGSQIEPVYLAYRYTLFRVARQLTDDDVAAEDAVQDVFIRLLRRPDLISDGVCNKTKALLVIMVRNIATDWLRAIARGPRLNLDEAAEVIADPRPDAGERLADQESFEILLNRVQELPSMYADILMLRVLYEADDASIADLLGISRINVRVRMHRARAMLRQLLAEDQERRY